MYIHTPGIYKLIYNNTEISRIYYWKSSAFPHRLYITSYWLKNPINNECLICQSTQIKKTEFETKIKSIQLECLNKLKEVIESHFKNTDSSK